MKAVSVATSDDMVDMTASQIREVRKQSRWTWFRVPR